VKALDDIKVNGEPLRINRLEIQKGEYKQLVYYWFKQRERIVTSEYMVKWWLFWDSLTRKRSDGALIRFTTMTQPGEPISEADDRLRRFIGKVNHLLPAYIPD